jgi:hypothetical protein
VTAVQVCRISGQLAAPGCSHVAVTDANGETIKKSMVATECFCRGTAPTEVCTLHPDGGLRLERRCPSGAGSRESSASKHAIMSACRCRRSSGILI